MTSRGAQQADRIAGHEFAQRLLDDGVKVTMRLGAKHGFRRVDAEFERTPDEHEFYVLRASKGVAEVLGTCSALDQIPLYLTEFTYSPKLRKVGVTRADYLHYTIENFIVRTQMVHERTIQMIARVFHLLMDSRDCTERAVLRHLAVARTEVPAAMKKLTKITDAYRAERNSLIHQESYKEDLMRQLAFLHLPHPQGEVTKDLAHIRNQMTRRLVAHQKTEFEKFNAELADAMIQLFGELLSVYKAQRSRLDSAIGALNLA